MHPPPLCLLLLFFIIFYHLEINKKGEDVQDMNKRKDMFFNNAHRVKFEENENYVKKREYDNEGGVRKKSYSII